MKCVYTVFVKLVLPKDIVNNVTLFLVLLLSHSNKFETFREKERIQYKNILSNEKLTCHVDVNRC